MSDEKWAYSFTIRPGERVSMPGYVWLMFSETWRREEIFTESAFWAFQMELDNAGYELHEVERVPYVVPEIVHVV